MREIKFRAWDTVEKEMVPWGQVLTNLWLYLSGGYSDKFPTMQYTGLKDKNGVEIYHKDICYDEFDNRWVVDWSDEYAGFELTLLYSPHSEFPKLNICTVIGMEVIGNIYENKELLEGK